MAESNIIFLENYVEGTSGMPPDLQRFVNTIKALDEKAAGLQHTIQQLAEQCIARHPQYLPSSRSSPASAAGGDQEDVASLRARIEDQQRLLILYVEEKVALASQAQDIIEHHLQRLNHDMREFEEEIKAYNAVNNYDYGFEEMPSKRFGMGSRSASRVMNDFDFGAPSTGGRRLEDSTQRRGSRLHAEFEMVPNSTPTGEASGRRSAALKKDSGYSGAGYTNLATPTQQQTSRKKAQRGGSRSGAAETAAVPLHAAPPAGAPVPMEMAPVPLAPIPGLAGLQTSAAQPQAPGTLLREADVNPALIGRRAELYWPDDNLWYIIEIQSVDLMTKRAQILYITGESEELDLNEIIKEGHMSLITM